MMYALSFNRNQYVTKLINDSGLTHAVCFGTCHARDTSCDDRQRCYCASIVCAVARRVRDAVWCVAMEGVMRAWPCVSRAWGLVTVA